MHNLMLTIQIENKREPISCKVAEDFTSRARGLLFSPVLKPGHGLLIACRAIHTIGMRFAIDVIYLQQSFGDSERLTIIHCVPYLKPWRISLCPQASPFSFWKSIKPKRSFVLELAAGEIQRLGIVNGQSARLNRVP